MHNLPVTSVNTINKQNCLPLNKPIQKKKSQSQITGLKIPSVQKLLIDPEKSKNSTIHQVILP